LEDKDSHQKKLLSIAKLTMFDYLCTPNSGKDRENGKGSETGNQAKASMISPMENQNVL
jgi:hypothetical protein